MNDHAKPHDVNGTPDPEDPGDGPGNGSRFGIRRPRTRAISRTRGSKGDSCVFVPVSRVSASNSAYDARGTRPSPML